MRGQYQDALKETGFSMRNLIEIAQNMDYWIPCECGIGPPGSISHVVNLNFSIKI